MRNTLLKLFENECFYTLGTDLKAWVTTVMYNSFVDTYRKRTVEKSIIKDIDSVATVVSQLHSGGDDADESCSLTDLYSLTEALSECLQQTFNLFVDGFTYAEIAVLTGVPLGTVKGRIYWIRRKLKSQIFEY